MRYATDDEVLRVARERPPVAAWDRGRWACVRDALALLPRHIVTTEPNMDVADAICVGPPNGTAWLSWVGPLWTVTDSQMRVRDRPPQRLVQELGPAAREVLSGAGYVSLRQAQLPVGVAESPAASAATLIFSEVFENYPWYE